MKKSHLSFLGLACGLFLIPSIASAAGAKAKTAQVTQAQLDTILQRLDTVEQENRSLKQQVLELQQKSAQTPPVAAMTKEDAKAAAAQQVAPLEKRVAAVEEAQEDYGYGVGFRTGYSESPYGMPGGFMYGAYLNYRLLTQEDGVPYGDIGGEVMIADVQGNSTMSTGNLASILIPALGPQKTWLQTLELEPTVQYHLDTRSLGASSPALTALKPYVLAGPGIYISMMSTPVVNGPAFGDKGPGQGFRHTDADLQPGFVAGLGMKYSLSAVQVPAMQKILNRISIGGEWRNTILANGEGFNAYMGEIQFGF